MFGNLFVFYEFRGQEIIGYDTRLMVFSILTAIGGIGVFVMLFLTKPGSVSGAVRVETTGSPAQALRKSFALFKTKEMMLLSLTFFYTGELRRHAFKIFISKRM